MTTPTFVAPTNLDDALGDLAGGGALAVGGGTSVALLLKNRLVEPERLVYLGKIPDLSGVAVEDGDIRLGATTTLWTLCRSPLLADELAVLARAASVVGNPRVRSVATLGGAVVHADPRQDVPPVLLALGARARVAGPSGEREVPFDELLRGFMETAVGEEEILTELRVSRVPGRRGVYSRFTPGSEDDYPTVAVAAVAEMSADADITSVRIALGGVAETAILAEEAASILVGRRPSPELIAAAGEAATAAARPTDDRRGSAAYKRAMVDVWTRRTLESLFSSGT